MHCTNCLLVTSRILEYMNSQNRPYNSKQVFEVQVLWPLLTLQNLHGKDNGFSAASVAKIMDDMVSKEKLSSKLYKNKPLYWANQDRYILFNENLTVKDLVL